jgi:ribosomal protein L40E
LSLPLDIASYLTRDEKVIKLAKNVKWRSGKGTESIGEIYVTNRRVIFKKGGGFLEGKQIVEASYHHISSVELTEESRYGYIVAGIVCLIFAYFAWWIGDILDFPNLWIFMPLIVAVLGIALFFVTPPKRFIIYVVGREPLRVSSELEDVIKIIREYIEKVEVTTPPLKEKVETEEKVAKVYCHYCGSEVPFDAIYCRSCGKKIREK